MSDPTSPGPCPGPEAGRRALLSALAALPAFGLAARARAETAAAAAGLITPNVCMILPEVTEGPYYLDPGLVRADIREDRAGVPLEMLLQVVGTDCAPIAGARVDIWHCDAQGNYSGYAGQGSDRTADTKGETFLRGTQMTAADGVARFTTIWPGWYRGRTTHLHYKVFLDEATVLTSQIFLPDALSEYIYAHATAYAGRASGRDTFNAGDGIARQAGDGAQASVREQGDRYVAALVAGVNPEARSTGGMRPGGPGLPPPGARPPGPPPGSPSGQTGDVRIIPGSE